jgi:HEAT repeat protein
MRHLLPMLAALGLGLTLLRADSDTPEMDADEQILKDAGMAADGSALLDFLRKRTLTDEQRKQLPGLLEQLESRQFLERQDASEKLSALGPPALPFLRDALQGHGLEMTRRLEQCIAAIERVSSADVAGAAARLIKVRKPDGAVPVLLAYVPFADDDAVQEDVLDALTALAVRDGKLEPALVQALRDSVASRRAAAALLVGRSGNVDQRKVVRALLTDRDAQVRFRAAQGLLIARDRTAVPALVGLLEDSPLSVAVRAEELLVRLAGERAPALSVRSGDGERRRCREAWTAWWRERGADTDLARVGDARCLLGYTLVAQYDRGESDRVAELGPDGKPRWQIDNLDYPVDIQWLPGQRVLIVEHSSKRVTERTRRGEIVWEKTLERKPRGPFAAQRLANGNTFIAMHAELLEVDRTGKDVFSRKADESQYLGAWKSADGSITFLTADGMCVRLDAEGKEVKRFASGHARHWTSGIDVLANGHVLVPQHGANKVVEFDTNGKVVWEAEAHLPKSAVRLPNGHTLVTSFEDRNVIELDRAGKVVWEHKDGYHQYRARRR